MYLHKLIITHQEPIEGMQVLMLLRYPCMCVRVCVHVCVCVCVCVCTQNMDEMTQTHARLGLKSPKLNSLPFLADQKFIVQQTFKYMPQAQFSL